MDPRFSDRFRKWSPFLPAMLALYAAAATLYVVYGRSGSPEIVQLQVVMPSGPPPAGEFKVPFYFDHLPIPPSPRANPLLVGHIEGSGVVNAFAFQAGYYGIAAGYSVDGGPINWINNGDCLKEWGADSPLAASMPVRLLYWKDQYDLAIAVTTPISFRREFKLFFENPESSRTHSIRSLHLYGYFSNFNFGLGNKLKL